MDSAVSERDGTVAAPSYPARHAPTTADCATADRPSTVCRRSGDSAASERDGTVAALGVRAPGSSRPNKQAPVRASMLPSTPVHTKHAFSYLSSERISYQQHSGLINLGMVRAHPVSLFRECFGRVLADDNLASST